MPGGGVGRVGHWEKITGAETALSTSADDPTLWQKDVRDMALQLYDFMLEFKKNCPCACPGEGKGTTSNTSSGEAKPRTEVQADLKDEFPREGNTVK